ncbi:MAG: archaetidylserine decarboxylase [Kofleriaceae bacterium]
MEFKKPGPAAATPFAAWATLVGWGARARVPAPLRRLGYSAFARAVGANLGETELELADYDTFGDFFARKLRPGVRPIDPDEASIISPCDGVVAASGIADDGELIQAKGLNYRLEDLVVDREMAERLVGGPYATIYLSPRDYHRVHAPIDARLVGYDYVPGELWPVNMKVTARRANLLARNERVVIWLDSPLVGRIAVVMVSAVGVGNIRLAHAEDSIHWRHAGELRRIELPHTVVKRGDELGAFRLGSTVVMCFQPGVVALDGISEGQAVRFGERLGEIAEPT